MARGQKQNVEQSRVGLCLECRHAQRRENDRGSVFYQCGLAATDSRFAKYPRLPVARCSGFMRGELPPVAPASGQ